MVRRYDLAMTEPGADQLSEDVQRIVAGYTFDEPAIELGVLMENDTPVPAAVVRIPLGMLNRHGLVAGATGTGKTKTLQLMAEQLSAAGVPVFAADIKGDLSGIATPGAPNDKLLARTQKIGQDWQPTSLPDRVLRPRRPGHRRPAARHHHLVRPDAAVQGARPQRDPGVDARPGLPLRRPGRAAAARPQGPARGAHPPHQRRGQGRAQGPRRPAAPRPPG